MYVMWSEILNFQSCQLAYKTQTWYRRIQGRFMTLWAFKKALALDCKQITHLFTARAPTNNFTICLVRLPTNNFTICLQSDCQQITLSFVKSDCQQLSLPFVYCQIANKYLYHLFTARLPTNNFTICLQSDCQ